MSQPDPRNRRAGRPELRKDPAIAAKQLARTRPERRARRPKNKLGVGFFLLIIASVLGAMSLAMFSAAYTVYAEYTSDLPSLSNLENRLVFQTTQIFARDGTMIYELQDPEGGRRTLVPLAHVSQDLINATVATEDKDFYTNLGVDPIGFARAVISNFTEGGIVSGASTITQQLAKNVLIEEDRRTEQSVARKLQEMILAVRISEQYSKDRILEMYLNEIYYGHQAYGIAAAAETYFGKGPGELTLAEAALLAGLPQAPSAYDPYVNMRAAKERQDHVINRMVDQAYITPEEGERAKREELKLQTSPGAPILAPHFAMYVRQLLESEYGANMVYRGGLRVTTTIDLKLNELGERAIRERLELLKRQNANNASLVAIDPNTGEILAMVGSRDYDDQSIDGQVNVATAWRQPGSTIKPIVYVTAFSKGWTPSTIIVDDFTSFPMPEGLPPYRPGNFDYRFDGAMTIRHALAVSKNVTAVKALVWAGIPDYLKTAEAMGVRFHPGRVPGLSFSLGGGEVRALDLTSAYATLAANGVYRPPVAILKIEDSMGNVIEEFVPPEGRQVISATHAYMITSILSDNTAREPLQGLNSPLKLTRPAAAKTGSTDSYRDSWLLGYTPDLVTGVWVGNTDNTPMIEVTGSLGAARIWNQFMEDAHAGKPVSEFKVPPGLREYRICRETGGPPTPECERVLIEVHPEGYQGVQIADIEGLPKLVLPANARPLGQTISPAGAPLVPLGRQQGR
jgi:1A family penicillin-binding protein